MDAVVTGKCRFGVIPLVKHPMPFDVREQGQPIDYLTRLDHHRFQQRAEISEVALDRGSLKQRCGVDQSTNDGLALLLQRECKVELRYHVSGRLERSHLQPG